MREKTRRPGVPQGLVVGAVLLLLIIQSAVTLASPAAQDEKPPAADPLACPPSQIEGFVFEDLNRDQQMQGNEPGIANVKVVLEEQNGTPIAGGVRVTDGAGEFCFEAGLVAPGIYRLVQQKVDGFETTGGQERFVTVTDSGAVQVLYPNVRALPGQTPVATDTPPAARETPTIKPSPTASMTFTPSPTSTGIPSATGTVTQTPTVTATGTQTPTPSASPSPSPSPTLRSLTPIATFITTTPGVLVTTTPFGISPLPIERLPDTGSGSNLLLIASALGMLTVAVGLARRLFFSR